METQFPQSFEICPKLCGNSAFPQNFHTKKLGEIMVIYAVKEFCSECDVHKREQANDLLSFHIHTYLNMKINIAS